jgi:protein TonB
MSGYAMTPRGQNRLPALLVAIALHAGVLALVLIAPSHLPPPPPVGSSVPINIVSSAPFTDTRPAVQAPETQAAAAPEPAPQAPPQPPAPQAAPPAFTQAVTQPPKVQKPAPAPHPSVRPAAPAAKAFDFNHLQQIIENARHTTGAPASSAARGPARAETAAQARPDAGHGLSQSDLVGLEQLLERLWNPNCDVVGGSTVKLQVKFTVDLSGGLLGRPSAGGAERSPDPVVSAAARRALDAVQQAAPYAPPYYGQPIVVNFDAKEACAKR